MEFQALLVHRPVNDAEGRLLFAKVAGLPLLLRNILALSKAKFRKIGVLLPLALQERYQKEVAPTLNQRGIDASMVTQGVAPLILPANALVQPSLPIPHFQIVVNGAEKIKTAEKALMETIRLSTPGPVAKYFNKRISLPISLFISRLGIHPNWITLANMMLGIGSGLLVAKGSYGWMLLAAFLFQFVSIFDGCDGEVAKLTFTTSRFGQYFDSLSDNGALISFLIGIVAAFSREHAPTVTLGLAALLLAGLGGLFWQMIAFLKKHTQSASLATFNKEYLAKLPADSVSPFLFKAIQYGKMLMSKDCFSMLFFVLALLGCLPWILYMAIGGTWVANGVLLYLKLQPAAVTDATK